MVKSLESRTYLIQNAKCLVIKGHTLPVHDTYPITQTKYPSEKILFRGLPFDMEEVLNYLYSQPGI